MGRAKPSPRPPGSLPPAPSGTRVRPPRSGPSRSPALGSPTAQNTPRTPGRFQSAFSVEAILARPDPLAPAAVWLSGSACAHPHLRSASSPCTAQGLSWPCQASWLPAYLSVSLYPLCSPRPMPGPRVAPVCGLRGLGVTGLELAHCSRLWAFPGWAPTEDLQDTERQQKRVRTMFNLEQLEELERTFVKQHNLVGKKRAQLAARLNLTENQVRVWFQNRRVKYQKQQKLRAAKAAAEAASLDEPSSSSSASIQSDDAESGVES
ncbi:homeobox protein notochord [Saimiri boliviensis]|uniref:homeobox protein notochord n=1 Tax=Saimiri boliviensis TaxID=27679 RepID=UPI00027F7B9B|nr:homeobox protein notochord [Saimiri boliviensis boliviensis]